MQRITICTTEIIRCARQGNPWTFKKYFEHVREIESPFECTVGDYHIATGGIDKTVCFRRLAGQLISGAITDHHGCKRQYACTPLELHTTEAKKHKKINSCISCPFICLSFCPSSIPDKEVVLLFLSTLLKCLFFVFINRFFQILSGK